MCLSECNNVPHDTLGQSLTDLKNIGLDPIDDNCDYISVHDCSEITCSNSDLLVLQLNIRGLIGKQSELSKLLNSCTKSNKIDVVIVCESWVTVETKHLVNIPGYDYIGIERHCR